MERLRDGLCGDPALERKAAEDARLDVLAERADIESRLECGAILASRGRWGEALRVLPRGRAEPLSAKEAVRLYDLQRLVQRPDLAEALAAHTLAAHEGEAGLGWLALRHLRDATKQRPEVQAVLLERYIRLAHERDRRRLETCLRAQRLRRAAEAGKPADPEDLAAAQSSGADLFRAGHREGAWREHDLIAGALRRGDKAGVDAAALRLLERHPGSPESIRLRHGLLDQMRHDVTVPARDETPTR